jgi:crotonobetainyl-CoA:carnitine CoA-transferase CaiB-like acyl-CoA transferase
VVQRLDLWEDQRFQTNAGRVEHRDELIPRLQSVIKIRTSSAWIELLAKHKIPAGPINDIPHLLDDPQVAAREMVQEVTHKSLGPIKQLGPVARLSETPASIRSAPPLLGEHTETILLEDLGYSMTEIRELQSQNTI